MFFTPVQSWRLGRCEHVLKRFFAYKRYSRMRISQVHLNSTRLLLRKHNVSFIRIIDGVRTFYTKNNKLHSHPDVYLTSKSKNPSSPFHSYTYTDEEWTTPPMLLNNCSHHTKKLTNMNKPVYRWTLSVITTQNYVPTKSVRN